MAILQKHNRGSTPEEAKLLMATSMVDLADSVRTLLDGKKKLEELGEAAAAAIALTEEETVLRDEAIEIVANAEIAKADQEAREQLITKATEQLLQDKENAMAEVESHRNQMLNHCNQKHEAAEERLNGLTMLEEELRQKIAAADEAMAVAVKHHAEADERHNDLTKREEAIARIKNAIG